MAEPTNARVAVYLDFDNIVISWYDRVHGRNAYGKDRQRITENPTDPEVTERLSRAMIEVGAIIDYAASFGTLVLTRAYADWSSPVNAVYLDFDNIVMSWYDRVHGKNTYSRDRQRIAETPTDPEIAERLVRDGILEGDILPIAESVAIMGTLDEIRAQIGVRYPREEA